MDSNRGKLWLTCLILGYLVLLAVVVSSMLWERHVILSELSTAESKADWESWRSDVRQEQTTPGPVERRIPKSDEPPALVLMRDYFTVSMFGATFFTSILYWIMAWFISGALGASSDVKSSSV